ncbi:hypothetical protein [Mucilaginibacter pedocola]|uniref:Glycerophosphoryl diester phosphodiesterase membrane domain-containing protein n=1 Tax=Mucilaginibacter pedocola TaxID=1792845 RepID=A0A1S9PBW5_9SPHI|nr:hypothetical protein [Mucilaginibacter pedocola]OOQ58472.1 hypothetical protein BC343_07315 [Mucilaginibacter pedocola]
MENNIELAKPRDFGEIIGDTFVFIRQNFKELMKNFFIFCSFFMIASAINMSMMQIRIQQFTRGLQTGEPASPTTFESISDFFINWVFVMVFGLCMFATNMLVIVCYIALYKQKGNVAPTTQELWAYFKYYFFRMLLSVFLIVIMLTVAYMVCLIPGVWLFPIFGLIFPIIVIENGSFGYAFSRAFKLISNNWWVTAGAVLIVWIIAYCMVMVLSIPASAMNMASVFLHPGKMPVLSNVQIIVTTVLQQLMQVFFIIPTIGICLCYFNLTETKEGTSLLERIDKFGQQPNTPNLPTEEY